MCELPDPMTLSGLQEYMSQVCTQRGWTKSDVLECFLLFMEEVGELASAIRSKEKILWEKGKTASTLGEELVDILSYLLELANTLEVDLEEEFRAKERKNRLRVWE